MSDDVVAAPGHELLLALAGWVDDDLLAIGRELVAVGEEVGALELVVASLAAARTALPHPVRRRLADAAGRRLGPDLARLVPAGAALPDQTPHVFDADAGDPDGTTRIGEVVAGLTAVRRSGARTSVTWRLTPAGAAPGPLPHPVVLLALDDPAVAEVLSYQVGAALARAGIPASVEAFGDGAPLPPYHRAALAAARPFSRPAPSPADDLAGATPTVATVTGPHGGPHGPDFPLRTDVTAPATAAAPPVPAGAPETGVGDTAPRLAAVGGSATPPAPVPPSSTTPPGSPSPPVPPAAPSAPIQPGSAGVPLPPVDGGWSGPGVDRPAPVDTAGTSPTGAHDGLSEPGTARPPANDELRGGATLTGAHGGWSSTGTDRPAAGDAPEGGAGLVGTHGGWPGPGTDRPLADDAPGRGAGPAEAYGDVPAPGDPYAMPHPTRREPQVGGSTAAGVGSDGGRPGPIGDSSAGVDALDAAGSAAVPVEPRAEWSRTGGSPLDGPRTDGSTTGDSRTGDSRTEAARAEVPPTDDSRGEGYRRGERREDAHRAVAHRVDAPEADDLLTDGSDPDGAHGYGVREHDSHGPGTHGDGRVAAPDRTAPRPSAAPRDTVRRPDASVTVTDGLDADDTIVGHDLRPAAVPASFDGPHAGNLSDDPGVAPPVPPGGAERAVDGIADVDPARFDPARNAVDRTVLGGNGIPVAGRSPTTADDPGPATPDAARTEPPRPGPSADQERPTASNGHPSPRPAPRRLPRPTPATDPAGQQRSAGPAVDGYATTGATVPDPTTTVPDPADEREWDRQWSNGSWSMPADPDIEPATSPTPTTPPPARVPSPTRRPSADVAPADAPVRPRHRLDVPEVFATADPDGLSSEDVLDSRLTPNEQELLRRLQQELAARERGSAEPPRNGATQPDAD